MEYPCMFLYMWEPFRQQLISKHKFYIEQARKRLLLQFEDVSGEADKFADEWLSKANQWFDPDRHDPDDVQEQAYDESIDFYNLLTDMHDQTRLSVIAGMYHEWDKQLREWLSSELCGTFSAEETKSAIWKATFAPIVDLFECIDWQVRAQPYFAQLDACRIVVNVYKHGLGPSFDELKEKYPNLLFDFMDGTMDREVLDQYLDHNHLQVTDENLAAFSEAIIAFWNDVPERTIPIPIHKAPTWFSKALEKDFKKREPKDNA